MSARADYPHLLTLQTRWKDNDVYGHVNNVEYYSYFDTAINEWLVREGGLDIHRGEVIGVCAESHCEYRGPIAFPEAVEGGDVLLELRDARRADERRRHARVA